MVFVQLFEIVIGGESGVEGLFYFVCNFQSIYIEWGWEIWLQGLIDGIMMIKVCYGDILIYIIENGFGVKDLIIDGEVVDDLWIDYFSSYIGVFEKVLVLGVDVCGYYFWLFIDLLSWFNGY